MSRSDLVRAKAAPDRPGEPPYLRGIHPAMYRSRLWTMRQYAGFGDATSCTAVEPASRMWYPLTEMGFHCGVSSALNSIRSVAILSDAAGG